MINPQLLEYVRAQRAAGLSKDAITQALATGGWSAQDANEAFMAIEGVKTPPPPPPSAPGPVAPRVITPPATAVPGVAVNPPTPIGQPMGAQSAMTSPAAVQPRPMMAASELNTAPVRARHTGRWILIVVILLILLALVGAGLYVYLNPSILTQYLPQAPSPAPTYVPTNTPPVEITPEATTTASTTSSATTTDATDASTTLLQ
jgi:hypothetical protein